MAIFEKNAAIAAACTRISSAGILILSSWGCGVSIGESVQPRGLDRGHTVIGPELGYKAYVLNSEGLTTEVRSTFYPKRVNACCYEFRTHGELGFGVLPLPYTSPVGFEMGLGPTIGNVVANSEGHFAVGGEAGIGVPFRVTRNRDLWEANPKVDPIGLLVPRLSVEMLSPVGDVAHRPITAIELSLTFRYMQWLTIFP